LETKAAELDLHLRKAQAEENIRSFQDHDSHLDVFVARNQQVRGHTQNAVYSALIEHWERKKAQKKDRGSWHCL
jgi:hypothetical protein